VDIKIAVTGFGSVGQGIAKLLYERAQAYQSEFGVRLLLTGAADRGGATVNTSGVDLQSLLQAKLGAGSVAKHPDGQAGLRGDDFLRLSGADVLIEAASTNFQDAEPGWGYVRNAIARDMDVVLASKGSLALFWDDLFSLAETRARRVYFSGTIGAPLPSLEIANRALVGTNINGFEGIVNGTSNTILTLMAQGASYDAGVRRAQEIGIAETDPTLDVDGWDAAAKTVILANAVLGACLGLQDVRRTGIRGIGREQLDEARQRGRTIKLIARAVRDSDGFRAEVGPEERGIDDPLGRLQGGDMGIVFFTDLYGNVTATAEGTDHNGALPTSMTALRDVFNLCRDRGWMTR